MKISDLENNGGFVTESLEKREIQFDGNNANVFVKKASFGEISETYDMPEIERNVHLLQRCVRLGDKGEEALNMDQVRALSPALAMAMLEVVADVNSMEDERPKSRRTSSSGQK